MINEFGPELAVIKGRIDGLESRVGEFEAGQFSATTKMNGYAIFTVGGTDEDESSAKDAVTLFKNMDEDYKVEIIEQINSDDVISTYKQSDFVDLCRGPHVANTSKIKHFKLLSTSFQKVYRDSRHHHTFPLFQNHEICNRF